MRPLACPRPPVKGCARMTATTKTGGLRKALAGVCALALALCLAVPALAISIPQRPENQYVLDEAGVLSEETEQEIIDTNNALFEETGAQVVVVAVDFLGGEDIEDYAYTLFNSWGIGSVERNNGLLLLLAIGEDNYYAMSGYGLEDYFDGAKLKEMLNDYLEEDFAARDYDAGVEKFFSQAVSQVKTYYANYTDEYTPGEIASDYDYSYQYEPTFGERVSWFFRNLLSVVGRVVGVVIVVAVLVMFLRGISGGGGPRSGGGGGGGFWTGLFLGNLMNRGRRGWPPPRGPRPPFGGGPRPPFGGGGFGGGGGFHSGGHGGFGGGGGGFHGGGGSHGGGAGRG